jgi:hypothetical protein
VRRTCEAVFRDARFAASWWHWFFFGQLEKPAERIISADPDAWYTATPEHMGQEAYADYQHAIHDPETVHAMLEDYRAGLGIDRQHDDDDRRAERRVRCPLLVLWAAGDDLPGLYGDVLDIWALSLWALVSGHWSAWQAARVEVNQEIEAKARADEDIAGEVVEQVIKKTDIDRA